MFVVATAHAGRVPRAAARVPPAARRRAPRASRTASLARADRRRPPRHALATPTPTVLRYEYRL